MFLRLLLLILPNITVGLSSIVIALCMPFDNARHDELQR